MNRSGLMTRQKSLLFLQPSIHASQQGSSLEKWNQIKLSLANPSPAFCFIFMPLISEQGAGYTPHPEECVRVRY